MESQIKILVENIQLLQTNINSLETTPKKKIQNKETRICYNCDKPGHLAKDCRRPRRQQQNKNLNTDRSSQSEREPLNKNRPGQQALIRPILNQNA